MPYKGLKGWPVLAVALRGISKEGFGVPVGGPVFRKPDGPEGIRVRYGFKKSTTRCDPLT